LERKSSSLTTERAEWTMTDVINEGNLVKELRKSFPELEAAYAAEQEKWHGEKVPSNYDVIGFVFKPRFKAEVEKRAITDFLTRSAAFLEGVSKSGDVGAINVIWIKIFEWLLTRPDDLKLLWPILGGNTKALIKDAAARWNSVASLPKNP
jgi:hypothetical protein